MGIKIGQSFQRTGPFPVDETLVLTKAQMRSVDDTLMPARYFAMCVDDNKFYTYDKTATANDETGKFSILESENHQYNNDTIYYTINFKLEDGDNYDGNSGVTMIQNLKPDDEQDSWVENAYKAVQEGNKICIVLKETSGYGSTVAGTMYADVTQTVFDDATDYAVYAIRGHTWVAQTAGDAPTLIIYNATYFIDKEGGNNSFESHLTWQTFANNFDLQTWFKNQIENEPYISLSEVKKWFPIVIDPETELAIYASENALYNKYTDTNLVYNLYKDPELTNRLGIGGLSQYSQTNKLVRLFIDGSEVEFNTEVREKDFKYMGSTAFNYNTFYGTHDGKSKTFRFGAYEGNVQTGVFWPGVQVYWW